MVKSASCTISSLQGLIINNPGNGIDGGYWYGHVLQGICEESAANSQSPGRMVILNYIQTDRSTPATNSTAVICEPFIKFQTSNITLDELGLLKSVGESEQLPLPLSLTAYDVADAVNNSIMQMETGILPSLGGGGPIQLFDNFHALIMSTQDSKNTRDLSNTSLITRGAQAAFQGVACQIIKRYLLVANSTDPSKDFMGVVNYGQSRLFVSPLSMRLMEFALSVLALVSMVLIFIAPRRCTPQDPASIAHIASLISGGQNLAETLANTGFYTSKSLETLLEGTYSASFTPTGNNEHNTYPAFVIKRNGPNNQRPADGKQEYWEPFSTSWLTRLALPIVPLCVVLALEVLLRKSQHNNGLLDVKSDRWTQLGSAYVPALVMVLTKLLFSSFDFNIRILDPYVQLKNGAAKARPSVLNKTIYTWRTGVFFASLRGGRIAVGASTLAMILASFHSIAVSSLYTPVEVSHNSTFSLNRLDQFYNPFAEHIPGLNKVPVYNTPPSFSSSLAARLAVYEEMSSPLWTYGPNVLPSLAASNTTLQALNASSVTVAIPVQKGKVSFTLIPNDQVSLNYTFWDDPSNQPINNGVDVLWPMPGVNLAECTNLGLNVTTASTSLVRVADGYWAQYESFEPFSSPVAASVAKCPSSWATFGRWQGRRAIELNLITCWSSIQESHATVSLSLPDWTVTSFVANESTAKNISDSIDTNPDLAAWVFSGTLGNGGMDNVFSEIIRNRTTGSLNTTLLQRNNFDQLYTEIQNLYGLAFAQILNLQGRNASITTLPTISGTATNFSTYRLKQDPVSTRVLQGLLIGLTVCSTISLLTVRLSKVIPKNPCSIAAQASLVAGSSVMTILPPEAQWMDDKEFDALFDGNTYSMGWKSYGGGERRFGIDVDDTVESVVVEGSQAEQHQ